MTMIVARSPWGHIPGGHLLAASELLELSMELFSGVESMALYATDRQLDLRAAALRSARQIESVISHVRNDVAPLESECDSSVFWHVEWEAPRRAWLQFRIERPHLAIVADQGAEALFRSSEHGAANLDRLIGLTERILAIAPVEQIYGRHRGRYAFWGGEPWFLYRSSLSEKLEQGYTGLDVANEFREFYSQVRARCPREEILESVRRTAQELKLPVGSRLLARFSARLLDGVDLKGVFADIRRLVDGRLGGGE